MNFDTFRSSEWFKYEGGGNAPASFAHDGAPTQLSAHKRLADAG